MTQKTYRVDLDYENYLFDKNYNQEDPQYLKIAQSFEYAFFLINQENCQLKNLKNYSKKYLTHLKNLGFIIPQFAPEALETINFWGVRKNKALEQLVNSKMTSARIACENGWGMFEGIIADKLSDVINHLERFPNHERWLIKRPHSFSGIGHYFFSKLDMKLEVIEKILEEPVILEPVYERVFDIGSTFIVKDHQITSTFMVENFNSENGRFKGAMSASDNEKFKKEIFKKYHYDLSELESITSKIAHLYLEMKVESNVQIDSFIYKENGKLKLYPLVEVNCRKTMGLVAQSLALKHPEASYLEWKIFNHKETQKEMKDNADFKNWIEVSPEDAFFKSFYRTY